MITFNGSWRPEWYSQFGFIFLVVITILIETGLIIICFDELKQKRIKVFVIITIANIITAMIGLLLMGSWY